MGTHAADSSAVELPAYSILPSRSPAPDHTPLGLTINLPATSPRQRPEHKYFLTDKKNKQWASLTLYSNGRQHSQRMPTFTEGELIEGSLDIDVDKKETIKSVLINVSHIPPPQTLHLITLP
jgi:hypothetical protein